MLIKKKPHSKDSYWFNSSSGNHHVLCIILNYFYDGIHHNLVMLAKAYVMNLRLGLAIASFFTLEKQDKLKLSIFISNNYKCTTNY